VLDTYRSVADRKGLTDAVATLGAPGR
jgi:hypothetical protein